MQPVANDPKEPNDSEAALLAKIAAEVSTCRACPRLVGWREQVAVEKRASYRDDEYWGRGVPGFGDPAASVIVLGLAPAAHGANRTGRLFTGDRSGDWLFRAMHRAGLADRPTSLSADDGLTLRGAYVSAVVRCAPPDNAPRPDERDRCVAFLRRELDALSRVRVAVTLGQFAYEALCREIGVRPRPRFGHGVEVHAVEVQARQGNRPLAIVCSFHPSQQNTFTGRLTEAMLDDVFARAIVLAENT